MMERPLRYWSHRTRGDEKKIFVCTRCEQHYRATETRLYFGGGEWVCFSCMDDVDWQGWNRSVHLRTPGMTPERLDELELLAADPIRFENDST
ncbi:MAG TPA: hypothetical protein VIM33_01630 [Gaiellaceae bacterium]|jgi:hydrogenase maturation factor HypF (carbamoyltransferase family)